MTSPLSQIQIGSSKAPSGATPRAILLNYLGTPECRRLIHLIQNSKKTSANQTVLLLSQFSKEGRTFVSALLALAASSLLRQRVLVVDTVHINSTDSPLYHLLPQTSEDTCSRKPPGYTGAIELALGKRLEPLTQSALDTEAAFARGDHVALVPDFEAANYLQRARGSHDLIILDGCALQALNADTLHPAILAQHSDLVLLVASPRSVERTALHATRDLLALHGIKPRGLVFNPGGVA